ncbi:MAG: glycosyltransferase family 2 protein [Azovibrio sp.]
MKPLFFTIYTPSYNRAHLLQRVYDSLVLQEGEDFEWLVIDDGSDDDTEARIATLKERAPFPVRYVFQANQGKHVATNRAVELAAGEMFVVLDSDDWLTEGSLRAVREVWNSIPEVERCRYANIGGLFLGMDHKPVTRLFPNTPLDCNSVELKVRYGISGEIAMVSRTKIRRKFPFPENVGRYCMPSLIWNRIAAQYLTRYVNVPFQYKEYQEQGITLSGMYRKVASSPEVFRLRSRELLEFPFGLPVRAKIDAMRMYVRASFHAGKNVREQFYDISGLRLLWSLQLVKGWRAYRRDLALKLREGRC